MTFSEDKSYAQEKLKECAEAFIVTMNEPNIPAKAMWVEEQFGDFTVKLTVTRTG